MADLLDDLSDMEDELDGAGAAASGLREILTGLGRSALMAATGFDSSASRFRAASGRFQTAGSVMSGAFQGAMNKVGSAGNAAAEKITALGAVGPEGEAVGVAIQGMSMAFAATIGVLLTLGGIAVDTTQRLDMLRSKLDALGGSSGVGGKLMGVVNDLGGKLPFATDQIARWVQSLSMVAKTGSQLKGMVTALAAAQALMGESGAAAAQRMFETLSRGGSEAQALIMKLQTGLPEARAQLAQLGLKTSDLAAALGVSEQQFRRMRLTADQFNDALQKALKKKGAGPLGDLALQLPTILGKAREGFFSLFDKLGPAVKPFMKAVQELFKEFGKGGGATKALKPIFTDVLGAGFKFATQVVKGITSIVKAIEPVITRFNQWRKTAEGAKIISTILAGLKAGLMIVGVVLGVVVAVATVATAIWVAMAGAIVYLVGIVSGAFSTVWESLGGTVSGAMDSVTSALSGLVDGATSAAGGFVQGLVGGIVAGGAAVIEAVKGLAAGALGAFKGVLGIASPSKVMLKHGDADTAGAYAKGIDKGTDKVEDAAARMGDAAAGGGSGGGKAGPGGKGGASFTFKDCIFGGGLTQEDVDRFMNDWWRRTALGVAPAPGGG